MSNFPYTVPEEETKYIWYNKVYLVVYQSNDEQHGTTKYLLVTALQLPAHNFTKFLIYCIRASSNNILPLNIVAFL